MLYLSSRKKIRPASLFTKSTDIPSAVIFRLSDINSGGGSELNILSKQYKKPLSGHGHRSGKPLLFFVAQNRRQ